MTGRSGRPASGWPTGTHLEWGRSDRPRPGTGVSGGFGASQELACPLIYLLDLTVLARQRWVGDRQAVRGEMYPVHPELPRRCPPADPRQRHRLAPVEAGSHLGETRSFTVTGQSVARWSTLPERPGRDPRTPSLTATPPANQRTRLAANRDVLAARHATAPRTMSEIAAIVDPAPPRAFSDASAFVRLISLWTSLLQLEEGEVAPCVPMKNFTTRGRGQLSRHSSRRRSIDIATMSGSDDGGG
jgi:hypothetical protein